MMKRSFRDKWADELESDRHTQGTSALKSAEGCECCLGVAMPLIDVSTTGQDLDGDFFFGVDKDGHGITAFPSDEQCKAMGISHELMRDLANRNDGTGGFRDNPQTFAQIAAHLRTLPVIED